MTIRKLLVCDLCCEKTKILPTKKYLAGDDVNVTDVNEWRTIEVHQPYDDSKSLHFHVCPECRPKETLGEPQALALIKAIKDQVAKA